MGPLRVASFQRQARFDDVPATVERLRADLRWCDARDVGLAVFPECYLQGYSRDPEVISRRALTLDGAIVQAMLETLESIRTTLILGIVERRGTASYNTAAVIRQGRLIGRYSKAHPNEPAFAAGTDFPVFEAGSRSFGINICNDANFPGTALRISRQGARLLCYPLNNMLAPATAEKWRERGLRNLKQRALETGCWVVSSDVVGQNGGLTSYGLTCIVRPDGEVVARVLEGTEGAALFDLD